MKSYVPNQGRNRLKEILVEVRVTRVAADHLQDAHEPCENCLVHRRQALPCCNDHAHCACGNESVSRSLLMRRQKRKERTFHEVVVLGHFFGSDAALDLVE